METPPEPRTDWADWQNDLIVADYFDMFGRVKAGERVNRLERNRELQSLTGRNKGSIERKRMNISAVLIDLDMDWMRGFAPNDRYQGSLVDAVERFLDRNPLWADDSDKTVDPNAAPELIEGAPPSRGFEPKPVKPLLERIARKHDHAARDSRNRSLGVLGEQIVFNHERRRLTEAGCPKLAEKVEWTARDKGDGVGYDILSFHPDGSPKKIEVKATNGPRTTPFFLTRTEREVSLEEPDAWRLYRLHDLGSAPGLFVLPPPLEATVALRPETWRASF
ncbi:MAG: DUF3883 domain-containing protein [Alphaproteobacteria bacterium]|nr:DUF3883 domain-containing protein [Alphaproteobacteria bacterium]MBU2168672.1 DUF3883 domain-containing protein [Alphaproteobacteria bacterium]